MLVRDDKHELVLLMDRRLDNLRLTDGVKSIALEQYPDSAWKWLSGRPDSADETSPKRYFRAVPWLYRGVTLRADAVASMPFSILRGETEIDTSDDYQNKVGFLPNPQALLWLIEAALTLEPQAYVFSDNVGKLRKRLRYILPDSCTPKIDPVAGVTSMERYVNGAPRQFKPGTDIVYFWRADPYTEIGPGDSSPGKAALAASGVIANIDLFVAGFFKRGAVKVTLFQAEGMSKDDADKFELWWKNFVAGITNAFRTKVLNSKAMTPIVVGEGIDGLKDAGLTEQKREDISTAMGIPHSLLFSNATNFATAQQDDLHFYSKTIVPECEFIAGVLNEQVFTPLGLRLEFRPETLDAFQTDEHERAGALQQLTSAGVPLLMAMDILGFELSDEQRAELEKAAQEKEQRADEMAEQLSQQPQPDEQPQPGQEPDEGEQMRGDMAKWQKKALKALERGKSACVAFESEYISEDIHNSVMDALDGCKTAEDVRGVFAGISPGDSLVAHGDSYDKLADAILDATKALREADAQTAGTPEPN
jgi:hypothetical protein